MTEAELQAREIEARAKLPLKRILEQAGSGPRGQGESWKSFKCPFCGHKAATVHAVNGQDFFKCFHVPCPADRKSLNEISLIAKMRGISNKDAWRDWMRESGVWKEERHAPSVLPGSSRRRAKDPFAEALVDKKPKKNFGGNTEEQLGSKADPPVPAEPTEQVVTETPNNNQGESNLSETSKDPGTGPSAESKSAPDNPPEPRSPHVGAELTAPPPSLREQWGQAVARLDFIDNHDRQLYSKGPLEWLERTLTQHPEFTTLAEVEEYALKQPEQAFTGGLEREWVPKVLAILRADQAKAIGDLLHQPSPTEVEDSAETPPGGEGNGGGGDEGGGSGGGGGEDEEGGAAHMALLEFYGKLELTAEDQLKLLRERGLTAETCRQLGFRSNRKANRDILFSMHPRYSHRALAKGGLWVWHEGEKIYKPNVQLSGLGLAGKKAKAKAREDAADIQDAVEVREGDLLWDWTEPPLIPYVNLDGGLFHLRPHKGQRKGQNNRFYVARPLGVRTSRRQCDVAVITEGEFKAAALWQVMRGGALAVEVGAIPGISNGKNQGMRMEILTWLRLVRPERVVIAYDNEEKGDPNLTHSYKEDETKRYDTQVWALVLARWLSKQGFDAGVAWLPNDWRDEKGKADWDGVLARRLKAEKRRVARKSGAGKEVSTSIAEEAGLLEGTYAQLQETIRSEWKAVLEGAVEPDLEGKLFEDHAERIIRNKVARLMHEPQLPFAADKEFGLALQFFRLGKEADFEFRVRAKMLANAFMAVQDNYYIRQALKLSEKDKVLYENLLDAYEAKGVQTGDYSKANFFRELLAGFPKAVANFKVDCKFVLVRANGSRERVVTLYKKGATRKLAHLDAKSMTAPRDFRFWLANQGNFTWRAGERELQDLQTDINETSNYLDVYEVTWYGWHQGEVRRGAGPGTDSRLWFADDCAITPEGKFLLPDQNGVIWWNGLGYMMAERDWEGQGFVHGRPKWHPGEGLVSDFPEGATAVVYSLRSGADDPEAVVGLFQEISFKLYETIGSVGDAYLVLGAVLAFAAAPELFEREKWFPGIWLHGERGGGKSTLAGWLMSMWGYKLTAGGSNMHNGSVVGMRILAQQYCNMPVWYEEFNNQVDSGKLEFLKSLHNREMAAKKEIGEQRRTIRTNAIITGEATSTNSATNQRFAQVQVSKQAREMMEQQTGRNHKIWFQENERFFFTITRWALLHRKAYVEAFLKHHREWCALPELRAAEERSKQVHGVGFAGFMAMVDLLKSHAAQDVEKFRSELVQTTMRAVRDVRDEVNVNKFWNVLLEAWKLNMFGHSTAEHRQFFKVVTELSEGGYPPGAPNQKPGMGAPRCYIKPWKTYLLYIDYKAVMAKLEEHLSRKRQTLSLSEKDLRDQMSKEPYWVPARNKDKRHKQRMGKSSAATAVWCVNLDYFPGYGYCPVTDEELMEARLGKGQTDHFDPRQGELYLVALAMDEELLAQKEQNG